MKLRIVMLRMLLLLEVMRMGEIGRVLCLLMMWGCWRGIHDVL